LANGKAGRALGDVLEMVERPLGINWKWLEGPGKTTGNIWKGLRGPTGNVWKDILDMAMKALRDLLEMGGRA